MKARIQKGKSVLCQANFDSLPKIGEHVVVETHRAQVLGKVFKVLHVALSLSIHKETDTVMPTIFIR